MKLTFLLFDFLPSELAVTGANELQRTFSGP